MTFDEGCRYVGVLLTKANAVREGADISALPRIYLEDAGKGDGHFVPV
jgi:hypothetical protein